MTKTVTGMVEEYYNRAGIKPIPTTSMTLIFEEFEEWQDSKINTTEELKELSDLIYVIYGYALARGYDLDEAVRRVHQNNMDRMIQDCICCNGSKWVSASVAGNNDSEVTCPKCSGTGKGEIKRREDGKIIKNPNTPKVNLEDLI